MLMIMQSGVKKLVYYSGEQKHGHFGNSNVEFVEKYGFQDKIELVEMRKTVYV